MHRGQYARKSLLASSCLAIYGVLAIVPPACAATYVPIIAKSSGSCLDVLGGEAATANGLAIDQWACVSGATNQQWALNNAGNGQYTIVAQNSGKCLDVPASATANGVGLDQWTCVAGAKNQLFTLTPQTNGTYNIKSVLSGKCVDVLGGPTAIANGTKIDQWTCVAGATNQQFTIGATTSGNTITLGGVTYTHCASENQKCSFSGTAMVVFGAFPPTAPSAMYNVNGPFTNGVACANGVVSQTDPAFGYIKQCWYATPTVATPDTTPPSVPTNLTATPTSPSSITLSWSASTDNVGVAGYKVYRNGVVVGTSTATSAVDSGLATSTTYSYRVAAYDSAGNVSAQSAAVSATTGKPPVINGVCGTTNGKITNTKPTSGLCSTGNASAVSGSGPWTWSCVGSNGGSSASCSASAMGLGSSPVPTTANCPTTSYLPPTLVNPGNPVSFGAKCDGQTDDTAAFQAAMDAGDVLVNGGTCLINGTVTVTVSNRHLQCAPGTVLKHTVRQDSNMFAYNGPSSGTGISGDSIVGCDFEGANANMVIDFNNPGHYDIPVQTNGIVNKFFLAGNTFSSFYGQSMFQTEPGPSAGSGDQIIFNTFKVCPLYGPVFVGATNGYIAYNTLTQDCTAGVENNTASDPTGGNILECNMVTNTGSITGGAYGPGADYSTNIVRYNIVTGAGTIILETQQQGGKPAQYIGNTCTNGCTIQ